MTTGEGADIDWVKVGETLYDQSRDLVGMSNAYAAWREQFPVLRRDLHLNERGGLFRWLSFLEIVSLERTEPFLADFGFAGCPPGPLRTIAQDTLRAIYAIQDDDSVPLSASVEILEAALDRLAAEAGPACADLVLDFGVQRYPYFAAESRREKDWRRLFGRLVGHSSRRYPLLETGLSPAALGHVRAAVGEHIDWDLNRLSIDADQAPLTPWEEVVYARCDGWSPFDVMSEIAYSFQINAAWEAIEKALSLDEMAALVGWGRRQAAVLPGMRPEEIAPPPTPRAPVPTRPEGS